MKEARYRVFGISRAITVVISVRLWEIHKKTLALGLLFVTDSASPSLILRFLTENMTT